MKLHKRKTALLILVLLILLLFIELLLRPRVFTQALASQLYKQKHYQSSESLLRRNAQKDKAIANTNLAKSLYKQDKYPAADSAAAAGITKNSPANAYYDRGNIAYKQQDYKKALENYRKALLLNPEDMDAKANYELTQRQLQTQPPPPPKPEPDKQKQEEIRNILGGLDNKESSDRKQQNQNNSIRNSKWW